MGLGLIHNRLIAVVYTEREPDTIRIISLRKANSREKTHFEQTLAHQLGKD